MVEFHILLTGISVGGTIAAAATGRTGPVLFGLFCVAMNLLAAMSHGGVI